VVALSPIIEFRADTPHFSRRLGSNEVVRTSRSYQAVMRSEV
jgi:hypothetical protein